MALRVTKKKKKKRSQGYNRYVAEMCPLEKTDEAGIAQALVTQQDLVKRIY